MGKPQIKNHKSRIRARPSRHKLGSRDYKNYSEEMMQIACEAVASKKNSSRDAERQFGIPRRTILNKIKNKHRKAIGHPTALSAEEEIRIVRVLQASSDFGSPLTKLDLKLLVHEYLKKNSQDKLFKNKIPGDAWVQGFLLRHAGELCLRSTQNISQGRAEKGSQEIAEYFENLSVTLKDIPAENIVNFDETNLSDDPGSSKGIFRRGVKYPERVVNSSKGNISLMFTATASGQTLPIYVVYKATHVYSEWVSEGPPNTRYNCTKSGWFDSAMFQDYFEKIILPWAQGTSGTKVVICDNLSSHLSIKVIELCDQNDIKFVFIPPRSTHLTQPLDVSFFAPMKKAWRQILYQYKLKNPSQTSLNKKHFPKLLVELTETIKLNEENNIKSGFKASGIFPLSPREVLKKIPEMQEEILSYGVDLALLDYLKEMRSPKPLAVKRNKKVTCEPGRSVTIADLNDSSKTGLQMKTKKTPMKSKVLKVRKEKISTMDLDERTGIFIDTGLHSNNNTDEPEEELQSLDDSIYFDDYIEIETDITSETLILRGPESLSMNCINATNSYMHHSENNETTSPMNENGPTLTEPSTTGSTYPFVREGNSKIPAKAEPGKITIQSYEIINLEARPQSQNVSLLNKVSNTSQNTPFATKCEIDLPECLKTKKTEVRNTVSEWKHIDPKDKLEIGLKDKKPARKHTTRIKKNKKINKCSTTNKVIKQMKKKVLEFEKENHDKEHKKDVACKKKARVSGKRRMKRYDSESTADSSDEIVTADSDNSDYATFQDYIAECLQDQEDKENLETNAIPFGMHDIEYFTADDDKLKVGDWVVVRFSTKKSLKHFVGKVLSVSNIIPTAKFVRKVKDSKCEEGTIFTYPTLDDLCTIPHLEDIITVLSEPKVTRRGHLIFNANLKKFNVQ